MAETETAPADLLVVAFDLVAERGWAGFSMGALAHRTGVPLVDVYRHLPRREVLFIRLSRRVDEAMLSFDPSDLAGLPPRDRIFELLMRRLDALAPFKAGLTGLARPGRQPLEPQVILIGGCRFDRSMAWLQEAAELGSSGLRARARRALLAVAYARTLQTWFRDETADLAKTMAELDKQLRRVEGPAGLRERRRPTPGEQAAGMAQPV